MKLFHRGNNEKIMEGMKKTEGLFKQIYWLGKKKQEKAIAFVDFEHWYYSYQKLYHLKPDIVEWRKQLEEKYWLDDVMVFADFSYKGIREELNKIRCMTNSIIETQQVKMDSKKDMTDFIMLDYIYQYVNEHPNVDNYILFTGDSHFQSVVKYLKQKHRKNVIIYGVKDGLSSQLKTIATEYIELPASEEILKGFYPIIVDNMAYVSDKLKIIPTFSATARTLSTQHDIPESIIRAALTEMLNKGLLYTKKQRVDFNQFVTVLAADWDALVKEGLWSY